MSFNNFWKTGGGYNQHMRCSFVYLILNAESLVMSISLVSESVSYLGRGGLAPTWAVLSP